MAGLLRHLILRQARDQWAGYRNLVHTSEAEKQLADIAIAEIDKMLAEHGDYGMQSLHAVPLPGANL